MKRLFTYITAVLALCSCANDSIVEQPMPEIGGVAPKPKAISFKATQRNITRAAMLQDYGHLNFGIFGYKSTDSTTPVLDNYLVGYNDSINHRGYFMSIENQTTLGDYPETVDGRSYWAYEKLGFADYTYNADEGYFISSDKANMSNHANQKLCYWDEQAPKTDFFAYSPYLNGTTASFDNSSQVMKLPETALNDGYDDATAYECMWASTSVPKDDYGKDVWLQFHRLNAKVNIKFYEEVDGYDIQIIDLLEGTHNGVQATAAIKNNDIYQPGEYVSQTGVSIDFSSSLLAPSVTYAPSVKVGSNRPLLFACPQDETIGTNRETASASPTTYYAIPKNNTTGFTFHVSFILTSDLGETLTVKNATAFVPSEYCNWKANNAYTYIFKITRRINGSTDPNRDKDIDPSNPDVGTEPALYPIVFDGANIDEWTPQELEHKEVL